MKKWSKNVAERIALRDTFEEWNGWGKCCRVWALLNIWKAHWKWQRLAELRPSGCRSIHCVWLRPFVDILNHPQNVKEQQFTLNGTRRRAVVAAADSVSFYLIHLHRILSSSQRMWHFHENESKWNLHFHWSRPYSLLKLVIVENHIRNLSSLALFNAFYFAHASFLHHSKFGLTKQL